MQELLRYYRHFGLTVDGAQVKDLPDSIPTVLQFMQFLCIVESKALSAAERAVPRAAQRDLLSRHLTQWTPKIAERVGAMVAPPVYASTVELMNAFCTAELAQLIA